MAEATEKAVCELLADSLVAHGVSHLYGLIGDANLFMVDAYIRTGKGRYIACNHEASSVMAAIGYAQVSGATGVATVTHGPALTNIITPLVEGVKGCIPLVVLVGDTPPHDLEHLQKVDQRELIKATGAGFVEMRNPGTAMEDLARAFRLAAVERKPVVFNMRVDLMWEKAPVATPPVRQAVSIRAVAPEGEMFDEALGMIASAKRPLVLAGRGAIEPEAKAAILDLASRLEAPVATTLKASGLFHGEPFNLGVFGTLSNPVAADTIIQSDVIIAFGASLSWLTTVSGAYIKGKRIVQIVGDMQENSRRTEPGLVFVGDPALTARRIIEVLDEAEIPGSQATDEDLRKRLEAQAEEFATLPALPETTPGTVDLHAVLRHIETVIPKDRVLVTDLGRFIHTTWRVFTTNNPRNFVYSAHFASVGLGLGEAIGAAMAGADRTTLLVAGDGGFMMGGMTELSTAIREKLDLVIIVCNDGSYGAEHIQFLRKSMEPDTSLLFTPDFAAVARSMGGAGVQVRSNADVQTAIEAIKNRQGPVLIELILDPYKIES